MELINKSILLSIFNSSVAVTAWNKGPVEGISQGCVIQVCYYFAYILYYIVICILINNSYHQLTSLNVMMSCHTSLRAVCFYTSVDAAGASGRLNLCMCC